MTAKQERSKSPPNQEDIMLVRNTSREKEVADRATRRLIHPTSHPTMPASLPVNQSQHNDCASDMLAHEYSSSKFQNKVETELFMHTRLNKSVANMLQKACTFLFLFLLLQSSRSCPPPPKNTPSSAFIPRLCCRGCGRGSRSCSRKTLFVFLV